MFSLCFTSLLTKNRKQNMNTEQIVYKINGINYVLMMIPIRSKKSAEKLDKYCKKYNAIHHEVYVIQKESFWNSAILGVKILVPEEHAVAITNED